MTNDRNSTTRSVVRWIIGVLISVVAVAGLALMALNITGNSKWEREERAAASMVTREKRFVRPADIVTDGSVSVLIDTETGVMYLEGRGTGLCVMVDRNGRPLIAEGYGE